MVLNDDINTILHSFNTYLPEPLILHPGEPPILNLE